MKNVSFRWIYHEVTAALKDHRVAKSKKLVKALRSDDVNGIVNMMTADESWCYWFYDHSSQRSTSRDLVPTRSLKTIDSKMSMFTLMFNGHDLSALGHLPNGRNLNNQYFSDVVLEEAMPSVTAITNKSGVEGTLIHMGDDKVHNCARTMKRLQEFQVTLLAYPPYSYDVSPEDF
jgi:hypothetical protein